jgi:hypothetical protein
MGQHAAGSVRSLMRPHSVAREVSRLKRDEHRVNAHASDL